MLKNYLKIAIRQLLRNKGYSIINILGLAVGLACCLLILLYVQDELNYDGFHEKADRIYRVALERKYPGRVSNYAFIPQSYAGTFQSELPEIENTTRLFSFPGSLTLRVGDQFYEEESSMWADSNFFEVFDFPLLQGDPSKVLTKPNSVLLTESTAKKYFGEDNPIGKVLDIPNNDNDLVVSGICADIPENSHFKFDLLQSSTRLGFLNEPNYINFSAYTYLVLKEGTKPELLEAKFPDLVVKYASGQVQRQFGVSYKEYQEKGNGYHYFLQPLTDIHLHSQLESELRPNGSITRVYIFSIIALFILLIACINFMNLATARSTERAKEVGIRKTLGSERRQIAGQFLLEAILISFFSGFIAWILIGYLIPPFNALADKSLNPDTLMSWQFMPILILIILLVGLFAGSYPSIILSSFKPLEVLRGGLLSSKHGKGLRNGLVIFQFVISVVLIVSTVVVYHQLEYVQRKELGFNKEHLVSIKGGGNLQTKTESFKEELLKLPDVTNVGGCNAMPGGYFFGISFRAEGENETLTGRGLIVDDNYLDCMQMEIVAGRSFSKQFEDSLSVVINEAAVRELNLQNPVGKRLTTPEGFLNTNPEEPSNYTIVGVVKDFHFQSLHQTITPLFFVHSQRTQGLNNIISLRIKPDDIPATISQAESIWKQFVPDQPFRYSFLDADLMELYGAEQTAQKVFTLFSFIAIFIACMGLLGLAAYVTQQRTKEIGIRKVLGASLASIIGLLSADFLKLVVIALVIATPVAWYFMDKWLDSFAYSISLSWWMFALAGLLAIGIAVLTVSYQSIRAALANPIKSLRNE